MNRSENSAWDSNKKESKKNIFKLNNWEIEKGKNWVNMYIDEESLIFLDMTIYNLVKSQHSILWYIHLKYHNKSDILTKLPIKLEKNYIDNLSDDLKGVKDFNDKEIGIIKKSLINFEDREILWIIINLEENSKEKILKILTNLESWEIKKFNKGKYFDNITLFFLLRKHWVDLYEKWNEWNKNKRRYISNYTKILNDLLFKSDFGKLLEKRKIIWKEVFPIEIKNKRINYI